MFIFWTFPSKLRRQLSTLLVFVLLAMAAVAQTPRPTGAGYTYQVVPAPNHTYGYEIRQNGRAFIRQLTVPGQGGTTGFRAAGQAGRVAQLVVWKLRHRAGMPTITPAELDSLRARP